VCFSVEVDVDLKKLAEKFKAKVNKEAFDHFQKLQNEDPKQYKYVYEDDHRIYAKTWAPVICHVKGENQIRPMRYQLLPSFSPTERYTRTNPKTGREVEIKGTYNARLDSLMKAKAWQKPFMHYHALLPVKRFFEWVQKEGKATMISFAPKNEEYLLAPCLYDNWYSPDKSKIIQSFAIITTDPNPEVMEMGHDRCPININETQVETWLSPEKQDMDRILNVLQHPHKSYYEHAWV
jgi:putative SOS response-associated peptidase YedK